MGLISSILTLPLAPIKGVLWLGEVIQDQVEQTMHDPATIRKELEQIDEEAAAGELSEEEKQHAQQDVLNRMIERGAGGAPEPGKE